MRRLPVILASIVVSAIFLYFALRDVPLDEVMRRFSQANVLYLGVAFIIGIGALYTRAIRWRGLVQDRLTLRDSFAIISITFFVNLLPLRAGELARGWLASQRGVPFMTAATSIIVERLIDTLTVVLFILFSLTQLPGLPDEAGQVAGVFGVLGVIGFGVLLGFARYPQAARRLLVMIERAVPLLSRLPLDDLLEHVIDGLQPLTDWRRFLYTLLWTAVAWGLSVAMLYTLHLSLGIADVDVLLSSLIGVALASFSIAIPVTVAAIGPFEAAIRLTGDIVGMDRISSISLGFLFHGMTSLVYIVLGVLGLLLMGVSLGDLMQRSDESAAGDEEPTQNR